MNLISIRTSTSLFICLLLTSLLLATLSPANAQTTNNQTSNAQPGSDQTAATQSSGYQNDLSALHTLLQKTPSYKDQIKGTQLQPRYDSLYAALRTDTASGNNTFDNYYKLVQLFFLLKDNHLGFHQFPEIALSKADLQDETKLRSYRGSNFYRHYPSVNLNTDSLAHALAATNQDSVEGIYFYDSFLTVGLYRNNSHGLTGVVLDSKLPHWKHGQVAIRLYEYMPHCYKAVYGHPLYKSLVYYSNEKFRNQSLVNSYFYSSISEGIYAKKLNAVDHVNIPRTVPAFSCKVIAPGVQYIRLGSFSASPNNMKASQAFYDSIKKSLTAPHLLIDLRDNTGGAEKVSRPYLKMLQQYAQKGKLYVLINNGTMSQGEIFTLQLKKWGEEKAAILKSTDRQATGKDTSPVKIYGQTTKGTITYGVNADGITRLHSGRYGVVLTDMRDNGSYLRYENVGVEPDVLLDDKTDWIQQVINSIESK